MSDGRAKRQIKKSRKYEAYDEERLHAASPKKYVLRLLETKDVRELLGEEVYLLWPDDGLWYPADVKKVDVKAKQADVIYTTTDEEETIDLEELMKDRCIALREARRQSYELGPDEVLDTEERPQASRSFARSGDGGSEASSGHEQDSKLEASDSYDDEDGDDGGRKHSNSAKRRRGSDEGRGSLPRRRATLSGRAQALLAAEKEEFSDSPEPSSPRVKSPQQERKPKDEFTTAQQYEQSLLAQISGSGRQSKKGGSGVSQAHFYGRSSGGSSGGGGGGGGGGSSDSSVRAKVVEQMVAALEKVAGEGGAGPKAGEPASVAAAVEKELFAYYGDAGKDYKAKYRSLIFNLRDDKNPDLRRRVLAGEIPPDKLVTFSANELASKEMSQWRETVEAEAMKAAVLDTESAARFSTAAALASKESGTRQAVDWRDNTLATKSPPRDAQPRGISPEEALETVDEGRLERRASGGASQQQEAPSNTRDSSSRQGAAGLQTMDSVRSPAPKVEIGGGTSTPLAGEGGPSTAIKGTSFNWSSIRANADQEKEQEDEEGGEGSGDEGEAADGSEEYNPDDEYDPAGATDSKPPTLAKQLSIAPSTASRRGEKVWHGLLGNACPVPLPVSLHYLAGNPALASGLPPRQTDVKGRVELAKVQQFITSLSASRSRITSLAYLRSSEDASEEERSLLLDLIRQYSAKERCGVFPENNIEYYLMSATSTLAAALLEAAEGAPLPSDALLVVAVHLKTLVEAPGKAGSRPEAAKSPSQDPRKAAGPSPAPPGAASPNPSTSNPPAGLASAPSAVDAANTLAAAIQSGQHNQTITDPRLAAASEKSGEALAKELMMPQGIDLSSLGDLAAVLGVSQGLNLLVNNQQGAGKPQDPRSASIQQPPQRPAGFASGDPRSPSMASSQHPSSLPQQAGSWAPQPQQQPPQIPGQPGGYPGFPPQQHFAPQPSYPSQPSHPGHFAHQPPLGPQGPNPGWQQQGAHLGQPQPANSNQQWGPPVQQGPPRPITLLPPPGAAPHRPQWRPPNRR